MKTVNKNNRCAHFGALLMLTLVSNSSASELGLTSVVAIFGVTDDLNYRGLEVEEGYSLSPSLEFSYSGFSAGVRLFNSEGDRSHSEAFISYSYSTEPVVFAVGVNNFDYTLQTNTEAFLEITGRQNFLGFEPSLYLAEGIDESTSFYEARLSKDFIYNEWLINPHFEISYGDLYTPGNEFNHLNVGLDITRDLPWKGLSMSISLDSSKPLEGLEDFTKQDGSSSQMSLGIMYQFSR